MRCSHCGYENESGTYRCQKCGNSLLPPLPRDIYTHMPDGNAQKARQRIKRLMMGSVFLLVAAVVGGLGLIVLTGSMVFAGMNAKHDADESVEIPAAVEPIDSVVQEDMDVFFQIDPKEDQLPLPDSDIIIGLPEYVSHEVTIDLDSKKVDHFFRLPDGYNMEILCYKMDYPFSKSAEEDYFMEEYQYDSLEGTEDQYFILQSSATQAKATVVDRIHKNNYEIIIYPSGKSEPDLVQKARSILRNEVVAKSSLVQEESQTN